MIFYHTRRMGNHVSAPAPMTPLTEAAYGKKAR